MVMVGVLVFCGQGSLAQLVIGIFATVLFIMLYNYCQPYEADTDDLLQSLCQFSIFLVLLSALAMKFDESERTSANITVFLYCSLLLPIALGFVMVVVEVAGDDHSRALLQRLCASAKSLIRRVMCFWAATAPSADDDDEEADSEDDEPPPPENPRVSRFDFVRHSFHPRGAFAPLHGIRPASTNTRASPLIPRWPPLSTDQLRDAVRYFSPCPPIAPRTPVPRRSQHNHRSSSARPSPSASPKMPAEAAATAFCRTSSRSGCRHMQ
jgi:hypothetical protein